MPTITTFTPALILLPSLLLTACNPTEPTENKPGIQCSTKLVPNSASEQYNSQIQQLKAQLIDTNALQPELTNALQEIKALRAQLLFSEQQLLESEAQQSTTELAELNEQIKILNLNNQALQTEVKALQAELNNAQESIGSLRKRK